MNQEGKRLHEMYEQLYREGEKTFHDNNFTLSINYFSKAEILANLLSDQIKEDFAKRDLARCFYKLGKYDEAYVMFETLESKTIDKKTKRYAQSQKAIILTSKGDYQKALLIYKSLLNEEETHQVHINIGLVYYHIAKFDNVDAISNALSHIERSFSFIGNEDDFWLSVHNLGLIYLFQKEFDMAFTNLLKAVQCAPDDERLATSYNTLGELCLEKGELGKADEYLDQALEIFLRINHNVGVGRNWKWRGLVLKARRDYFNGYKALKKAEETLKEVSLWKELFSLSWHLFEMLKETDPEKAVEYQVEMKYYAQKIEEVTA